MNFPLRIRFPRLAIVVEFTREGLIFLLLSLAIGAAAVNTGNNVLYLIFSLMLGLIVVSGILSRRVLRGLKPRIDFPEHIFAGVQSFCSVEVENKKKRIPSIGIVLSVSRAFPSIRRSFFFVPARSKVTGFAPACFPRRGRFQLTEMELRTRFPFSFFIKIQRYFLNQEVRVYPGIYHLPEEILARVTDGVLMESPYRGDSQQLLYLRDYGPFDSSKRIHWKASAKLEKLQVKEFQRESGRDLSIYFDCYPESSDSESEQILDKGVSFLASLALLFLEKGITAKILFAGRSFDLSASGASILPLLDYLADLQTGPPQPGFRLQTPSSPDAIVLELRSSRVPPKLSLQWPSKRLLFLEDWAHLLCDAASGAQIKIGAAG